MSKYVARLAQIFDERILRLVPGPLALQLRIKLLRYSGAYIGKNVIIGCGTRIIGANRLVLEDNVSIARDAVLDARGGLRLGLGALIGFESILLTSTHNSELCNVPIQNQGMYLSPTEIGKYSWLGTRCIVLPGVTIGKNTIVGSGSVVTKSLEASKIFVGSPARELRQR